MTEAPNSPAGFSGLRVLTLKNRRVREMGLLIANNVGQPLVAPTTHEVPAEDKGDAMKFVSALRGGRLDLVTFLTAVGTGVLA